MPSYETLLEKALHQETKVESEASAEDVELFFAWLQGRVEPYQIRKAQEWPNGNSFYSWVTRLTRSTYRRGLLEIKAQK